MNAIFNIDRFGKLEKRDFFLTKIHYFYIVGGLIGLYLLSMLLYSLVQVSLSGLINIIMFFVIVSAPCFFNNPINKNTSIFNFILPASTFEKFLSMWLKYVFFIPGLIFLVIFLLNLIASILPFDYINAHAEIMSLSNSFFNIKMLFFIAVIQASFMVGYFYFRKYAFAKTSLILLLLFIFFVFIFTLIIYFVFEEKNINAQSFNFTYGTDGMSNNLKNIIEEMSERLTILKRFASALLLFGLWVVSFLKLRETEI